MGVDVNYLAIVVAATTSMGVGFVWYGLLFKKQWMSMMGMTAESMSGMSMSANKAYLLQFITFLIMAYVLSISLTFANSYLGTKGVGAGIMSGFWNWLGYVVPVTIGVVLWEGKPWKLWCLTVSGSLISMVVMGIILSLWV